MPLKKPGLLTILYITCCFFCTHVTCTDLSLNLRFPGFSSEIKQRACVAAHLPFAAYHVKTNQQSAVRICKSANNIFFCSDRGILCLVAWLVATREACDFCATIRIAEECNRLAMRSHPVCVRALRRRCDDPMEC